MQRKSLATLMVTVAMMGAATIGLASSAQAADTNPTNRGWGSGLNRGWEVQPQDSARFDVTDPGQP